MNISKAKHTGKMHREKNEANEDFVLARHIADNISVAILADGAGSKKYGGTTAACVIKYIEQYCVDKADRDDFLDCIKAGLFPYVNKELVNMIQKTNSEIDDYGATMLFVIVYDNKYVAGHVGDGVVLFKNSSAFKVLSMPENGEYVNQTYFVPVITKPDHFRMYEGVLGNEFCFILSSDGISGTLYNPLNNQVSRVCEQLYYWCKNYEPEKCDEILQENLAKVFDKYSDDDMSIVVLCDSID